MKIPHALKNNFLIKHVPQRIKYLLTNEVLWKRLILQSRISDLKSHSKLLVSESVHRTKPKLPIKLNNEAKKEIMNQHQSGSQLQKFNFITSQTFSEEVLWANCAQ